MKNYILIAMIALLGFSSCKKEPIVKKYNHPEYYIRTNDWVIVDVIPSPVNGATGQWLLQVKDTNNYLIIDPAPDNMYWKNDLYHKGTVLHGFQVIKFNIKTP